MLQNKNNMNNKNTIIFVNQSAGYLMIDIINAFKGKYSERVLITGFLNPRNRKLEKNVKVVKTIQYRRTNYFFRFYTWFIAFLHAFILIKFKYKNSTLFLVSNPPLSMFIPLFCSNPFTLLIYDVYPDVLVDIKILNQSSIIVKNWQRINRKIFSKANRIFTLTEGMKKKISQYVAPEKIQVVPVWTDNNFLRPIKKSENHFIREYGLENKFVILYSGNLGKTHPVEIIVDLARLIKDKDILFLIIGSGEKYGIIQKIIFEENLQNIRLLPWQPTDRLPFTLSAADLAVVTLDEQASNLSIPSKTYNFLSVGSPILVIGRKNSDLARFVEENHVGKSFEKKDIKDIVLFIKKMRYDRELKHTFSQNAFLLSKKFTPANAQRFV
ncbi:glycosyltransferase family 4 protein [Calditrichota bacterium GD2]